MNEILNKLNKIETINVIENMPNIEPIPIPTKNLNRFQKLKALFATRKWKLTKNYILKINGISFFIHKGFITNWASIPRIFWTVLSPTGPLLIASLFHDFIYSYNGIIVLENKEFVFYKMNKSEADHLLKLITDKVNEVTGFGYVAEKALQIGGYFAWHNCRKENAQILNDFPYITKFK